MNQRIALHRHRTNTIERKRPPREAASIMHLEVKHLLGQAFNGESTEFRVLVADLPGFLDEAAN